ncbi:MAG TPA: hypothetical protein VFK14_09390 [Solirubrobacterales bacterium]|nr:hypothetical protein [Solirubrobacterales bacterium]
MVVVMEEARLPAMWKPLTAHSRDRELVWLVGRHGAMSIEHVMMAMRCGRTASYRRVARCVEGGLIERHAVPGVSSGILIATRSGLSYAGLGLPVATVSPATITHTLRCAFLAIRHEQLSPGCRVFTEREIVLEEAIRGERFASVVIGRFRGHPKMHRPDLLAEAEEEGKTVLSPVEVELTPKSPARLRTIISAWRDAVWAERFSLVQYSCKRGQTRRAVQRAIASTKAKGAVAIIGVKS